MYLLASRLSRLFYKHFLRMRSISATNCRKFADGNIGSSVAAHTYIHKVPAGTIGLFYLVKSISSTNFVSISSASTCSRNGLPIGMQYLMRRAALLRWLGELFKSDSIS
jgi:hypothetical protein